MEKWVFILVPRLIWYHVTLMVFTTLTRIRDVWQYGATDLVVDSVQIFFDGFKLNGAVTAGIFSECLGISRSIMLLDHRKVFQAEVSALHAAVTTIRDIRCSVFAIWVPEQSDISGNYSVDERARLSTTIRLADEFAAVGAPLEICSHAVDSTIFDSVSSRWVASVRHSLPKLNEQRAVSVFKHQKITLKNLKGIIRIGEDFLWYHNKPHLAYVCIYVRVSASTV